MSGGFVATQLVSATTSAAELESLTTLAQPPGIGVSLAFMLMQAYGGATPAKMAFGIKVVRESDGEPLGGWLTLWRGLCHFADVVTLGIGFVMPLWDDKRQTFADKAVGSIVIRDWS